MFGVLLSKTGNYKELARMRRSLKKNEEIDIKIGDLNFKGQYSSSKLTKIKQTENFNLECIIYEKEQQK